MFVITVFISCFLLLTGKQEPGTAKLRNNIFVLPNLEYIVLGGYFKLLHISVMPIILQIVFDVSP